MWYIIYNGQQVGPLERQQLSSYNLTPGSMVWHEGMPEWQPAGNVPELQDILYHDANGRNANGYPNFGASDGKYPNYGQPQYGSSPYGNPYNPGYDPYYQPSGKKVAAGVLAILLGWLGVQYFYLGKIGGGLLTILLTLVTCGFWEIITFIQGIVMLTMSDQEFDRKFVNSKSTFPLF
ncbi:MAG: GYF domain-containing protein [Muribaculaceae bacterium]|nr:GYF domain-containing protein [Muribaculaceae bacterium]